MCCRLIRIAWLDIWWWARRRCITRRIQNEYVRLHDINGGGQLHITPTEMLLTTLTGTLPGGGSAAGKLRIENWLGEVPANVREITYDEGCGDDCE